jgi:hypothetical protein
MDYGAAQQTLVLALSTKCHYCEAGLPFYKRLIEAQQLTGGRTQMVAVFPNSKSEVERYIQQNQLHIKSVPETN